MPAYGHEAIERKWQERWDTDRTFYVTEDAPEPKFYNLQMYPYPSGDLHMGHIRNYVYTDLLTRYRTMQGLNTLSPMGWDSFGLPAENAAIETGIHPRVFTDDRIATMAGQLRRMGAVYDWDRELACHTPEYYRWTQWLFLQFFHNDLAYKKEAPVNWCPSCQTVLANEQVVDGRCERCGTEVVKRDLEQWFFAITKYAQRLLDDLEQLGDWPERVQAMQEHWIGRSEGAEFEIRMAGRPDQSFPVYTTRPDTIFGMTFVVLAPEHPLVHELVHGTEHAEAVMAFADEVSRQTEVQRLSAEGEKRGLFIGARAVNPANGDELPVYVADYVLMSYGTGAIMGVPAHDERDFEFAKAHGLPIPVVIAPPAWDGGDLEEAYLDDGIMVNSGQFDGLPALTEGIPAVTRWLEEQGIGEFAVQYRLRDWLISRQRYWGCPIPIVYCPDCGIVPVPEAQLPVLLPELDDFTPKGRSPLASAPEFVETVCPDCAEPARRETDTMDTFVDSSWYFLRYCDAGNARAAFDREKVDYWLPIDQYIGGVEHAVLHLLYARFFTKVLYDLDLVGVEEPFRRLFTQGMITKAGAAMSKSKGNVVPPDAYFQSHGADALRLYHLFIGPPTDDSEWSDRGVEGPSRFLDRVWRLGTAEVGELRDRVETAADRELWSAAHRALRKVTEDVDRFAFNTAVAALMEFSNTLHAYVRSPEGGRRKTFSQAFELLLLMLAPMAPHVAHELWESTGHDSMLALEAWPKWDPGLAAQETVIMVIQVNGKVRDRMEVPADIAEEQAIELALSSERVRSYTEGVEPSKVIARPPRLVNIVAG
ncbi:MAG: leucine--tRNA ligase [Acidimicrobiia bacterium]